MPAEKRITREKILKTAVELVKKGGIEALNVRSLANACKCSTQPIYLSFKGIDELQIEVAKEVLKIFDSYIENEINSGRYPEYKAVGMGYIRFAKEQKQLFKYLLMNEGIAKTGLEKESFETSVFMIIKNYGLYRDEASKLHMQMWIYVHGLASMFVTDYVDWDEETVSGMVSDAYRGFMKNFTEKKNDN